MSVRKKTLFFFRLNAWKSKNNVKVNGVLLCLFVYVWRKLIFNLIKWEKHEFFRDDANTGWHTTHTHTYTQRETWPLNCMQTKVKIPENLRPRIIKKLVHFLFDASQPSTLRKFKFKVKIPFNHIFCDPYILSRNLIAFCINKKRSLCLHWQMNTKLGKYAKKRLPFVSSFSRLWMEIPWTHDEFDTYWQQFDAQS